MKKLLNLLAVGFVLLQACNGTTPEPSPLISIPNLALQGLSSADTIYDAAALRRLLEMDFELNQAMGIGYFASRANLLGGPIGPRSICCPCSKRIPQCCGCPPMDSLVFGSPAVMRVRLGLAIGSDTIEFESAALGPLQVFNPPAGVPPTGTGDLIIRAGDPKIEVKIPVSIENSKLLPRTQ